MLSTYQVMLRAGPKKNKILEPYPCSILALAASPLLGGYISNKLRGSFLKGVFHNPGQSIQHHDGKEMLPAQVWAMRRINAVPDLLDGD